MPEQLKIDFKNMVVPNEKSIFNQKVMEESLRELLRDSSVQKVNIYDFRRIRIDYNYDSAAQRIVLDMLGNKDKSICNIVFFGIGDYSTRITIGENTFIANVSNIPRYFLSRSSFSESFVPAVTSGTNTTVVSGVINNNIIITLGEETSQEYSFLNDVCKTILHDSIYILSMSYNDILKQKKEALKKASVERFKAILNQDCEKKIALINSNKRSVTDLLSQIEKVTKQIYSMQAEVDAFQKNVEAESERKFREIFSIEELDSINTVNVTPSGEIEIVTNEIVCKSGTDVRYKFGRYQINYSIVNGSIVFTNLEEYNKRKGFWGDRCHHPHISKEGKACLGNVASTLSMLFTTMEWKSLASVLISFLEAVNTSDPAGAKVGNWDYYDKFGNLIPSFHSNKICTKCGKTILSGNPRYFASNGKQEDANIYCEDCIEFKDNKYVVKEG